MSRRNVGDLPMPRKRYRVDRRTGKPNDKIDFETLADSRLEDELRRKLLRASLKGTQLTVADRKQTKPLLDELERGQRRKRTRFSAASRIDMRDWRIRICGALWQLLDPLSRDQFVFFTAAVPKWSVTSEQLANSKADEILKSFRGDLYRGKVSKANGWLYAAIHGEYDDTTGRFQLHIHGVATLGMVEVLRRVQARRKYRPSEVEQQRHPDVRAYRKLKIQKPRRHYVAAITYTSKSYWMAQNSAVDMDGKRKPVGRKHRIPGIHNTRYLLWLDAHSPKQLTLLVYLRVTKAGLVPTR